MLKQHQEPYIQEIKNPDLRDVRLFIKREDVIHPFVSGNKWQKLKYNLEEAKGRGYKTLLTFGGAYSNHIYATAAAAHEAGFQSIGIIRGEELRDKTLNSTLQFAVDQGMRLEFVDRQAYRQKTDPEFLNRIEQKFGSFYLIPEGGTNKLALKGAAEIVNKEVKKFDYICCAVGTGGTIAGIISAMQGKGQILGFAVLKGSFLQDEVQKLLKSYGTDQYTNWQIIDDYHFGGYAKTTPHLLQFIDLFQKAHHIPLEPIYTGKMLYGVFNFVKKQKFPRGSRILTIHTGGLRH